MSTQPLDTGTDILEEPAVELDLDEAMTRLVIEADPRRLVEVEQVMFTIFEESAIGMRFGKTSELTLDADELGPGQVALFFPGIGIDEANHVFVGPIEDRLQQRRFAHGIPGRLRTGLYINAGSFGSMTTIPVNDFRMSITPRKSSRCSTSGSGVSLQTSTRRSTFSR